MELVNPGIGLIFWMTLAFLIVLYVLRKFAWKPILKALSEREESIRNALHSAEKAREEIKDLKFSNEQLLMDAKNERDSILAEARKMKENIIEEARLKAGEEANRVLISAKETIQNEKLAALTELKNQIGEMSLNVAKKILKRELADPQKQQEFVKQLLKEMKFN